MNLRLLVNDKVLYEGPAVALPGVGEDIHHDGEIVRVEAVVWDFGGADEVASVNLLVGDRAYTY